MVKAPRRLYGFVDDGSGHAIAILRQLYEMYR